MKGENRARSRKSAAMPLSAGRFPPCCSERPFRWRHRNMLTPESDKRRCHSEKRSRPALRAAAHRRRIHGSFRIRSAQPAKNGTCQKAAEDVLGPDAATPAVFRTGRRARIAAFPPHEPGRSQKEARHSVSGTNASGMLHDASATIPTESTAAFPAADTHSASSFPRISSAFVVNKRASPVPQDFYTSTHCNYLSFYFSLL